MMEEQKGEKGEAAKKGGECPCSCGMCAAGSCGAGSCMAHCHGMHGCCMGGPCGMCAGRGRRIIRVVIGLIILAVVFCIGVRIGEMKDAAYGYGAGYGWHPAAARMMGGYYAGYQVRTPGTTSTAPVPAQ